MKIVIEIDDKQTGTTQSLSVAPKISTEYTSSDASTTDPAATAAANSGGGINAGAGPTGDFTQMNSTAPFIPLPFATTAMSENTMNALPAGGAPGEPQAMFSNEQSTETEDKE